METNQLTSPINGIVYQRDNNNRALVPVVGSVANGATSVTVSLMSVDGANYQASQTFDVDASGNYSGAIDTPGGWYSLLAQDSNGATNTVARFGVGEVFILFGHSFIQGGHDVTHQFPATDSRVVTLLDDLNTKAYQFGQLTGKIGPFHGVPDAWGQLGDLLVKRLNVPVMFYGCAYGGSNLQMNLEVIDGLPLSKLPPGYKGPETRQPFAPLEDAFDNYVIKSGVRAILVEHGYNDRGTDHATFTARLTRFFSYVRDRWQKPELAVIMVQEQLTPATYNLSDPETAQGTADFIATYPNAYKGPDFNAPQWASKFVTHDHLYGDAIDLFATDWSASLSDSFFANSTPYPATDVPAYIPTITANAPTGIQTLDWFLLTFTGIVLVLFYIRQNRRVGYAFLLLALLCLSRLVR